MFKWRFWVACFLFAEQTAQAIPLDTIGTFCGTFPSQCQKGTMALMAARGSGTNVEYIFEVDPTTGAIPVSGTVTTINPSVGATGAAVPASGTYIAGNDGGNLRGVIVDSSGRQIVTGSGAAGTAATGVLTVQGIASMTPLLVNGSGVTQPVSGTVTANQGGAPWSVTISSSAMSSGRTYADSARNAYASVNVTTGAWVELIASTAATINCLTLFDSSGQTLELGTGAAASETRKLIIPPGGHDGCIPLAIPASTRVAIRAVSGTASTGEIDLTGLN